MRIGEGRPYPVRVMNAPLAKYTGTLLLALLLVYCGDWVVFEIRLARKAAFGTVLVQSFLTTPLKGNKAEYDYLGQVEQPCARSIFPHASEPACWWVERHKDHWE